MVDFVSNPGWACCSEVAVAFGLKDFEGEWEGYFFFLRNDGFLTFVSDSLAVDLLFLVSFKMISCYGNRNSLLKISMYTHGTWI